jgi:hypothetical protein
VYALLRSFPGKRVALGFLTALLGMAGSGVVASSAMASGHCNAQQCAWADANWNELQPFDQFLGSNLTAIANFGTATGRNGGGCTHAQFNDCASSIDNNGAIGNVHYYENISYGGNSYQNNSGTGTNFLGSFWNDRFSSVIDS